MSRLTLPFPTTNWILPEHQRSVVEELLRLNIVKFDNARTLPLTSGGKTDIYFDVRAGRNSPEAQAFLIQLALGPFQWLRTNVGIDRFLEVPHAVSGLAGILSHQLNMPYTTIRPEEKKGRKDATTIGDLRFGESGVLFDDAITDGASKLPAHKLSLERSFNLRGMLVFCDRQQGWRQKFTEFGITLPVWAGLTLHDIRRELIGLGAMVRCDIAAEARNPIIIALDGKSWDEYLPLLDALRTKGCIWKVNDLAFFLGIALLLPELMVYGRVMLDLKLHEIPNTVANTCKHLLKCPPWGVTVHASGGGEMVRAARSTLPASTLVIAITLLTSINPKTCDEIYNERPLAQVLQLAKIAWDAGARGFVCSVKEAQKLRRLYPEAIIITPGVRSPGEATQDQQRVGTPADAMASGANYWVGGRQFTNKPDPAAEVERVLTTEVAPFLK